MAQLYLQLLGDFEARDKQGSPVSFPTRKAQGLVAYLALPAGRFHAREKLASLLWGRSADEQARSSLRQTLSSLRRTLAEHDADVLVTRGESLALDASGVDSDVDRLESAVTEAAPAEVPCAGEPYNGELLEGFSLHEEAFEEWLEGARRRLREAAVQAMAKELDHRLSCEEVDRGIVVAGRLLALEPLREDVHRSLMRLYVQSGRRGTALQQYEHCRRILRQELGTRPEPETERLASDIRAQPRTEFATCGDVDIAYQVLGQGPVDLIYVPGWASHIEYGWEYSGYAKFLRRLASFSRLIVFDKRGTGLSEREVGNPSLEERMDDIRAVLDAVGSEKAAVLGVCDSGSLACSFAANYPDRTSALVLYGSFAKRLRSGDYPWGYDEAQFQEWLEIFGNDWGGRMVLNNLAPSAGVDSEFHDWFSKFLRYSTTRRAALKLTKLNAKTDVRHVLPAIHVPTLVTRRRGDRAASAGDAEYLAEHIEGAKLVELPGDDHVPFAGDIDGLVDEIKAFVTGVKQQPTPKRLLLTLVYIDPSDREQVSAGMSRAGCEQRLEIYDDVVRDQTVRHHVRSVKHTTEGYLLAFDGTERALRCAAAIGRRLKDYDLGIRAGVHVGECEAHGDELSGPAVRLAARIKEHARERQIIASRTVKDLTIGTDVSFERIGWIAMDETSDGWEMYSVTAPPRG